MVSCVALFEACCQTCPFFCRDLLNAVTLHRSTLNMMLLKEYGFGGRNS